jgi:Zn-dependent peptidase ImmA (M78 family)
MRERDLADRLLRKHWAGRPLPIDPAHIARAEGLHVQALPQEDLALSGSYRRAGDQAAVFVNPEEPSVRQRFTVAHELGHHFLGHGNRFRDSSASFSASTFDPVEAEANRFAAELLMPAVTVRALVEDQGIAKIEQLSNMFGVSTVAMRYRLKNLGYLR